MPENFLWAKRLDVSVSQDGARIEVHGGGKNVHEQGHSLFKELVNEEADAFVVRLFNSNVTTIRVVTRTHKSINAIAEGRPEFKKLNVSSCRKLTDESIKAIAEACTELNVSSCCNLTDESIKAIARHCPELKELNVAYCTRLRDSSIIAIAKACHGLEELDVSCCHYLTNESIKAIASGCPELKKLSVSRCRTLRDESMKAIANHCHKLEDLNVQDTNLTDESIKAIARCHGLKGLNVQNTNLTGESINAIAQGCTMLKKLNIQDTYLTDESIETIATSCRELEELNVKDTHLTDKSIKAIAKGCPKLKELNVQDTHVRGESIKAIAERCTELKLLNVQDTNLTGESIKEIAKYCLKLEELNISGCRGVSDEAIEAIGEHCHELKELNYSHCQITNDWIRAFRAGCLLWNLNASHCGLASLPPDIGYRLPELRVLNISNNFIIKLPPSVVNLKHLQELDVSKNPLLSPTLEIARQGMDAIMGYLKEHSSASKLVKVVLVGDGEAGKTTLRNALAGRKNPRQKDRTSGLEIDKITLTADLDVNVYDCGGHEENVATQLAYLQGLALYIMVVEAEYATDKHAEALEGKLHSFLVVLQNRNPGAVVLPIVTKTETVDDPETRRRWLAGKIEEWQQNWQANMGSDLPNSSTDDMPLRVSPVLAVSISNTTDVQTVRDSVKNVCDHIVKLSKHDARLWLVVRQQIQPEYMAVLKLYGAIAQYGDNDSALDALRNGEARPLGQIERNSLSLLGRYRPKDELKDLWKACCNQPNAEGIFHEATELWEAQGLIFVDDELVVLQPEFIKLIVKPLIDHRYNEQEGCETVMQEARTFAIDFLLSDMERFKLLIDALDIFRDTGEVEMGTPDESLLLYFFWHETGLHKSHYGKVLQMLERSGVIFNSHRVQHSQKTKALSCVVDFRKF